jgi:hypothetical protein
MSPTEVPLNFSLPHPARPAGPGVRWRSAVVVFVVLWVVALGFALYTQHVWEDFYITYRASKNLATGHGLTFTAGERVHSFTSPLGTLLPAAASLLTGNSSDTAALWIFRVFSITAYAGAGVLLWRLACRLLASRFAAVLLLVLLATDAKTVDFTVNGMETPYLLLFLIWALDALFLPQPRRALQLGLASAGLMWSRPDSFVYLGLLAAGVLVFGEFRPGWEGRRALLRDLAVAAGIVAIVYGPWVLWAWWYYGSPVPHTIIAKGLTLGPVTPRVVWGWLTDFPMRIAHDGASLGTTFLPPYGSFSGWPGLATRSSFWLSALVGVVWLLPRVRWEARVTSLAFLGGHFYLNYCARFHAPWYVPTLTALAILTIAAVVDPWVGPHLARARWIAWMGRGLAVLVPVSAFLLLLGTAWQMRQAQAIIETGHRRAVGEWLKSQAASPRDTVFLECLGYIGFFSDLKMYDFPGLCSPEVVALRRRSSTHGDYVDYFPELIAELAPDWVVLRASEQRRVRLLDHELLTRFYQPVRTFDVKEKVAAVRFLPGRIYLEFDANFAVFHRNPDAALVAELKRHVPIRIVPIGVADLVSRETWAGPAYESEGHIAAHAPSRLTVPMPAGASKVTGRFGFFPGAYEKPQDSTAGGVFAITLISTDGSRVAVFSRTLNPRNEAADRGDQTLEAVLPPGWEGTLEFTTQPPPGLSNAYGWTYWRDLSIQVPKR